MAKRTVDFSDYQEQTWEEYTGEEPPANRWFTGVVKKGVYRKDDDQMMFIVEIADETSPYNGWGKGVFCDFAGERKFIIQELLKALQGGKTKPVSLDWENEAQVNAWLAKQRPIKFKTREYNGDIKIGKTRALLEAVPNGVNAPAPAPGVAAPAEPEADGDDVEDYTEEELADMEAAELVEILVKEFEVPEEDLPKEPAKPRRDPDGSKYKALLETYQDDLIDAILAEQDPEGEGEGDGDTPDDDPEGDDPEFQDGFDDGEAADPEPDPEPEPAKPARRSRATKAAPAAEPAPAATTRTRRSRR